MDESGAPVAALGQQAPQQPQQNQVAGLAQAAPQQQPSAISKHQVVAGLHHFSQIQKTFGPLLKLNALGKTNIRSKIFDACASLIGQGTMSVPEVMNGIKDLPGDPVEQKKWLEKLVGTAMQAEKKLVHDYIAQGPGPEPEGPEWSADNHMDHKTGLMGNYKRG